jgi:hypothetical protein
MPSSSVLFEQQAESLLNELCTIMNEKWPVSNQNGQNSLKSILNSYTSLFRSEDSEDEETGEESKKDALNEKKSKLNHKSFTSVNECNENFDKLAEVIKNFEVYTNRMTTIKTNIFNLLNMKLDIFSSFDSAELNLTNFKNSLTQLCDMYEKECNLKSKLVNQSLFKSRFNRDNQIAIMSAWIHQPFLDEYFTFKFVSFLKFYFPSTKK